MALIVQKYGGTSVGDVDRIKNVARLVKAEKERGNEVAVVVSAMSGKTNELVGYCRDISELYDQAEYDVVVSSGEQITVGLLAMALTHRQCQRRQRYARSCRFVRMSQP